MIIIAHRGNLEGPKPHLENQPEYLLKALEHGFQVEIDVWNINNQIFLGHDNPAIPSSLGFLNNPGFWCHAKNIQALDILLEKNIHCFFHNTDDVTLTSQGYMWTYIGKPVCARSICLMPELTGQNPHGCAGVCTDYPIKYFDLLNHKV